MVDKNEQYYLSNIEMMAFNFKTNKYFYNKQQVI